MDTILVKIFATALALSQVTTQPQAVKTRFDAARDQDEVVQILRNGCAHMRQAFDIESINLDELIATALDDPKAVGADIAAFHGLNFGDLNTAYHQFCKNESVANPVVKPASVAAVAPSNVMRPPAPIPVSSHGDAGSRRIAAVQRALTQYGYGQLKPTGTIGSDTQAALSKFERDRKLPVTGQMSERVVKELTAMIGHPID